MTRIHRKREFPPRACCQMSWVHIFLATRRLRRARFAKTNFCAGPDVPLWTCFGSLRLPSRDVHLGFRSSAKKGGYKQHPHPNEATRGGSFSVAPWIEENSTGMGLSHHLLLSSQEWPKLGLSYYQGPVDDDSVVGLSPKIVMY